jgi:hypothetical protein
MKNCILLLVFFVTIFYSSAQDVYIYSNTTWSSDQTIDGDLWIWNGAELRIDPGITVDFVNSSAHKIIIRPDGKLLAGGVNFISSTGIWYGITMDGLGEGYPQLGSPAQPKLRLVECLIQNARYAVNNWYSNPITRTGGNIYLKNCVIEGFESGVWFSNYRPIDANGNFASDRSRIIETEFIPGGYNYNYGVYMYRVTNVQVLGCKFDNTSNPANLFNGIHIITSAAIIKNNPNIPYTPVKCQFLDCTKGVYVDNGYLPTIKVTIRDCIFDNIYYPSQERVGIQAIAARNLDVYSNQIKLAISCQNSPCTSPKQYGIHLNGCSGFHVEGNLINVSNNKGNFQNTYGIVVVNSGGQSNEIYRNTVLDCYYSIQAVNKNRGMENPWQPDDDGLRFFCNTLAPDQKTYDFFALSASVEPAGLTDPVYGVARMQAGTMTGSPTSPAFNVIERPFPMPTGSERDFFNNHQGQNPWNLTDIVYMEPKYTQGSPWYYIEYYTGNQNNLNVPNHVDPTYHPFIIDDDEAFPRCESRIPSSYPPLPEIVGDIYTTTADYQFAVGNFQGYANGGDHAYMLNIANSFDSTNYMYAYTEFLSQNPSYDVLAIMAAKDDMPASYVADILLQNTYGIKNGPVRDALANRNDTLSQQSLNAIFQAADSLSQYEIYEMEVSYYRNELRKKKNELHNYYLAADTTLVNVNGIISALDSDDDFQSKFSLILHYYEVQDSIMVDAYKQILGQLTPDTNEMVAATVLFDILDSVYFIFSGDYTQLQQSQIDQLEDLSEGTTVASSVALSALEAYLGFSFELISSDLSSFSPRTGKIPQEPLKDKLAVFPNPAGVTSIITINTIEPGTEISIMDLTGRILIHQHFQGTQVELDVSSLANGIYLITVFNQNKPIGTEKLVIQK